MNITLPDDFWMYMVNSWTIPKPKFWAVLNVTDPIPNTTWGLIPLGTATILVNTFVLYIAMCDQNLRRKSAFMTGLASGNMLNGIFLWGYAITYWINSGSGILYETYSIFHCVAHILPIIVLFAWQIPAIVLCMAGMERMAALCWPTWYYKLWGHRRSWIAVILAYAYVISLHLPALILFAWMNRDLQAPSTCDLIFLMDHKHSIFLQSTAVACGSSSILCTIISLASAACELRNFNTAENSRNSEQKRKRMAKQVQLAKCMFTVAIFDLCLVVIPNVLFILIGSNRLDLLISTGWPAVYCYCANSLPHPFIYAYFNKRFRVIVQGKYRNMRSTVFQTFCVETQPTTSVTPIIFDLGLRN